MRLSRKAIPLSMAVKDHSVVSFQYTLYNTDGEILETSTAEEPTTYLHGANNIIRGLETAMAGRETGDQFEVELSPEQAYGPRLESQIQRVPVKHLLFRGKLMTGMVVQLNTDQGRRSVTVHKVGRHSADVDTNHPLAGLQLRFAITILDIRLATDEELAHGHAHGPGGHQH
jgi:FKBP-type peptidyl-prolyl cis-trans isomerase SlyD